MSQFTCSCTHLFKVFLVMALCEVGLYNDLSRNLLVWVGFLYTVIRSSLLLQLTGTKQSRKRMFSIFFDFVGKLDIGILY